MSLKIKFLPTVALIAAFAAFSMAVIAQGIPQPPTDQGGTAAPDNNGPHRRFGKSEGFRRGPGGPGMIMGELRGIDLTDAQKQQIHGIMEANKPDQAQMDQMRTLMDAKRSGTLTPDQQAQLKAFHQQGMAKGKQIHDQIMAVLTPDQVQQIEQRRKERMEHWEQRKQQQQTAPPASVKPSTDN